MGWKGPLQPWPSGRTSKTLKFQEESFLPLRIKAASPNELWQMMSSDNVELESEVLVSPGASHDSHVQLQRLAQPQQSLVQLQHNFLVVTQTMATRGQLERLYSERRNSLLGSERFESRWKCGAVRAWFPPSYLPLISSLIFLIHVVSSDSSVRTNRRLRTLACTSFAPNLHRRGWWSRDKLL